MEFMRLRSIRVADVFTGPDGEGRKTITHEEFTRGLQVAHLTVAHNKTQLRIAWISPYAKMLQSICNAVGLDEGWWFLSSLTFMIICCKINAF